MRYLHRFIVTLYRFALMQFSIRASLLEHRHQVRYREMRRRTLRSIYL